MKTPLDSKMTRNDAQWQIFGGRQQKSRGVASRYGSNSCLLVLPKLTRSLLTHVYAAVAS